MSKTKKRFGSFIDTSSFEILNPEFTKAKAYILYADENRNGSSMSKEVVETALPSLFNVPVVGEFFEKENEEDSDFGTHGGRIIIDDNGIKYEQTTMPYGVLPSDSEPYWEFVMDDDGTEKEYLVSDIILWSGRYEELEKVFENKNNQSMEISIGDGKFREDGVFQIDEFTFSALCILGSDVEPCFQKSRIEVYSGDEENVLFKEMFSKYQEYLTASQVPLTDEPVIDEPDPEFQAEPKTPVVEPETPEVFEVSFDQLRDWLSEAVRKMEDDWVWVRDFNSFSVVYTMDKWEDGTWIDRDYRINYTIVDDEIVLAEEKERVFGTWATQAEIDAMDESRSAFETKITELNAAIKTITGEKDQLTKKVNDYEANVRVEKEEELFSEFDSLLKGSDEYDELKVVKNNYSIDELEDKVYALYGRFSKPATKAKVKPKMASNFSLADDKAIKLQKDDPYGGIFAKKKEEE
jgi:hypothetical protein